MRSHIYSEPDERVDSIEFRDFNTIYDKEESFCNKVAANFLIPSEGITPPNTEECTFENVKELAERYQVSDLVSLFRLFDIGYIKKESMLEFQKRLQGEHEDYKTAEKDKQGKQSGDNYYMNMRDSNGNLFDEFVFSLHLDGRLSAIEAQNLLKMPLTEV